MLLKWGLGTVVRPASLWNNQLLGETHAITLLHQPSSTKQAWPFLPRCSVSALPSTKDGDFISFLSACYSKYELQQLQSCCLSLMAGATCGLRPLHLSSPLPAELARGTSADLVEAVKATNVQATTHVTGSGCSVRVRTKKRENGQVMWAGSPKNIALSHEVTQASQLLSQHEPSCEPQVRLRNYL